MQCLVKMCTLTEPPGCVSYTAKKRTLAYYNLNLDHNRRSSRIREDGRERNEIGQSRERQGEINKRKGGGEERKNGKKRKNDKRLFHKSRSYFRKKNSSLTAFNIFGGL